MAGIDVSLDTEAVEIAVNLIGDAIEAYTRMHNDFIAQVDEAITISNNRFEPLKQLKAKTLEESANITGIVQSLDATKEVIERYAVLAEQANDASVFM